MNSLLLKCFFFFSLSRLLFAEDSLGSSITSSQAFTLIAVDILPDSLDLPLSLEFSKELQEQLTIYDIQITPSNQFIQTPSPDYESESLLFSQPTCLQFNRFLATPYTLRLFVSLEKIALAPTPQFELVFLLKMHKKGGDSLSGSAPKVQRVHLNLKGLNPVQHYSIDRPKTVSEGKLYYDHFNEAHLKRNLSFQAKPQEHFGKLIIVSHPRCGTNLFRRTLENVLGEFSSNFIGLPETEFQKMTDFVTTSGEIRGHTDFIRFYVEHSFDWAIYSKAKINKIILNVRNPLDMVDSRFQLIALGNSQLGKLAGEYWRSESFKSFMTHQSTESACGFAAQYEAVMKTEFPFFVVRFEDLIANPLEVLCDSLSYIESIPCEFSWKEKLRKYLEANGLVSYYKKTKARLPESPDEPVSKYTRVQKSELFQIYDQKTIKRIYNVFRVWIHFSGYSHLYEDLMDSRKNFEDFRERRDDWKPKNFEVRNRKSIEMSLKHQLNGEGKEFLEIVGFDEEELQKEIILRKIPFFLMMEPIEYEQKVREGTKLREETEFTRPEEEIPIQDCF